MLETLSDDDFVNVAAVSISVVLHMFFIVFIPNDVVLIKP